MTLRFTFAFGFFVMAACAIVSLYGAPVLWPDMTDVGIGFLRGASVLGMVFGFAGWIVADTRKL